MTQSSVAELTVTADHIARYRERVVGVVAHLGKDHDDAVAAIFEAERALRVAHRALERAAKLLG